MAEVFFPGAQQTYSWYQRVSYLKLQVISCSIFVLALNLADGFSWPDAPDALTAVEQGYPFDLHFLYKMDDDEVFLHSQIYYFVYFGSFRPMASRYGKESTYERYKNVNSSFSVFGKNNVTLTIHMAEIGLNITYCCKVAWRIFNGIAEEEKCSAVFVYELPRINPKIPQVSCKQGDFIRLQCNATGIPTPRIEWLKDETQELIVRSSDILLNITGKASEKRYCCDADNGFGRETACTAVNVEEYNPENTTLFIKQTKKGDVLIIYIQCHAVANPPLNHFMIKFNENSYYSRNGVQTIEVPTPRKETMYQQSVSCIPFNKYGPGPRKESFVQLYTPPRFIIPLYTRYNMTGSGIIMKCEPTGIPTPTITWTSGNTGDIVGTGKYCEVPYVKCARRSLTFYCHARNVMGRINSTEIQVEVMTIAKYNCSTADKGLDQTTSIFSREWKSISIAIGCGLVLGLALLILILRKRKLAGAQKDAELADRNDEDDYQDPIDIAPEREGLRSSVRDTADEGYATVEECSIRTRAHHQHQQPIYESLVPTEL